MFLLNAGIYATASPLQKNGLFPPEHSDSVIQLFSSVSVTSGPESRN